MIWLALVGWLAAVALAACMLSLRAQLDTARAELRGANYRAAAGWNAWEELKFQRGRSLHSEQAEGYTSFSTIDEITGKAK